MGPCDSIGLALECVIGPVGTQPVSNVDHRADPPAEDRMLQVSGGQRADPFLQPKLGGNQIVQLLSASAPCIRGHAAIGSEPRTQYKRNFHNALRPKHLILVPVHQLDKGVSRTTMPRAFGKFPCIAETVRLIGKKDKKEML